MKILLVEDDHLLGDGICTGLTQAGFAVDWAKDGREAELAVSGESYDAVILDLGLPRVPGLDVLRGARAGKIPVPILILTARDTVTDRIAGLDAGADDYMVKPFDLGELQARLRALVRRANSQVESVLTHGDLRLDSVGHSVTFEGRAVALSAREFAVLQQFCSMPGASCPRPGWKKNSTVGVTRLRAMRSRCLCTTCAASCRPSLSAPCAAWAT